jgi:hypothetical protein
MSLMKTGFVAAALVFAASLAQADSSVPVQGTPVLRQGSPVPSSARFAFAQATPAGRSAVALSKAIGTDPDPYVRLQLLRNYGSWNR